MPAFEWDANGKPTRMVNGPCDPPPMAKLPAGCNPESPLGQDAVRNQRTFTNTTEVSLGTTLCPSTAVTVVVNAQSDAGANSASVKVYSVLHGIRTLEKTFTMPASADSLSHDFTWAGTGCDFFEVTFTPAAAMAVPLIWCIQGFGEENAVSTAGGSVTLAGDVTGASNANTVAKLTGSGGVVTTSAGLQIKPAASGGLTIGDFVNSPTTTIEANSNIVLGNNTITIELTANTFIPQVDNTGQLGTNANRWSLIRGVTITSGDLDLERPGAHWTFREMPGWVLAINRLTKQRFKLPMLPLSPEENEEAEESERTAERYISDFDLSHSRLDA